MKKFTSGLIAFIMAAVVPMTQVYASDTSLDSAIDTLQYRLTVEWDQKDMAAQKKIMNEFSAELDQLKKQGVTNDQIFSSLSSRAFDAQTSKDVANLASYAKAKNLDQKQVRKLVVDYANKSQTLGTNWSAGGTVGIVLGIALVAVLIVVLAGASGNGYATDCYDVCGYDAWGYYYCDTYCD